MISGADTGTAGPAFDPGRPAVRPVPASAVAGRGFGSAHNGDRRLIVMRARHRFCKARDVHDDHTSKRHVVGITGELGKVNRDNVAANSYRMGLMLSPLQQFATDQLFFACRHGALSGTSLAWPICYYITDQAIPVAKGPVGGTQRGLATPVG